MGLAFQILKKELKEPCCIAVFDDSGFAGARIRVRADKLRKALNSAGIKFAAVDSEPPIEIFIEKEGWKKVLRILEGLKIKLPTVFDLR